MERKEKIALQIHTIPQIHKDTAEEVLQAFRTYLASHPATYFDGMDSIVEFLYIQFTETNPVESKEVKESYIAFMDELVKLIGFEEADRLQSMVNASFAVYVLICTLPSPLNCILLSPLYRLFCRLKSPSAKSCLPFLHFPIPCMEKERQGRIPMPFRSFLYSKSKGISLSAFSSKYSLASSIRPSVQINPHRQNSFFSNSRMCSLSRPVSRISLPACSFRTFLPCAFAFIFSSPSCFSCCFASIPGRSHLPHP